MIRAGALPSFPRYLQRAGTGTGEVRVPDSAVGGACEHSLVRPRRSMFGPGGAFPGRSIRAPSRAAVVKDGRHALTSLLAPPASRPLLAGREPDGTPARHGHGDPPELPLPQLLCPQTRRKTRSCSNSPDRGGPNGGSGHQLISAVRRWNQYFHAGCSYRDIPGPLQLIQN
jgi:hypothetical protein